MSSDTSYKALKEIWARVSIKAPDGKNYILFKVRDDIVYLYCTGFVDEKKHTLKEWVEAFDDSRMPNGMYMVGEDQWMDKVRFRYSGPVGQPFDPMSVREGDWPEAAMEKLIQEKILPAVYFTEPEFRSIWNEARATFYKDGIYRISAAVKNDLKSLLDSYPSPAQVRALGILEAKLNLGQISGAAGLPKAGTSTAYAQGPTPSQVAAGKLAALLSKK